MFIAEQRIGIDVGIGFGVPPSFAMANYGEARAVAVDRRESITPARRSPVWRDEGGITFTT